MVLVAREYAHERGKDIGHHPCQHACRLWRGFGGRWNEICRVRHCLRGRIVLSIWWRRKFWRWLVTFRRHSSLIIWRRSLHHAFRRSESFRRHLPFKSWRRCPPWRRLEPFGRVLPFITWRRG